MGYERDRMSLQSLSAAKSPQLDHSLVRPFEQDAASPAERGLRFFLKVEVLFLFDGDSDAQDRAALEPRGRTVLPANGVSTAVSDKQPARIFQERPFDGVSLERPPISWPRPARFDIA